MIATPLFRLLGITIELGAGSSEFGVFLNKLFMIAGVVFILLVAFFILRMIFRRLSNDLPLVSLEVSRLPLLLTTVLIGLRLCLPTLTPEQPGADVVHWLQVLLTVLLIGVNTYWVVQLFSEVLVYALKRYAERSEAMWDDVAVPIIQTVLPLLAYLVGGLLILQSFGANLGGLLVALGGVGFILGFALKDILANFFSGLVLLIDTPFAFGDVISLHSGERAIIRKIGLRVTQLYLIESHAELYVPNAKLESDSILNLSRPTSHYYYTISIPIKADVDPTRVIDLMQKVVLAHPGTMGNIEQKLQVISQYYGHSLGTAEKEVKNEAGRQRLIAEQYVSKNLSKIETTLANLSTKLGRMEKGGLDGEEIRLLQSLFLEVCEMVGLEPTSNRLGKRKRSRLIEVANSETEATLIGSVRLWYQAWGKDPDLFKEDTEMLPRYWEQKLRQLKAKVNKVFQVVNSPTGQETRIDDEMDELSLWMQERFKASRSEWQDPKVLIDEVTANYSRNTIVRFYIDDIRLEHCERGTRIKSEVRQELVWHLRQVYLI